MTKRPNEDRIIALLPGWQAGARTVESRRAGLRRVPMYQTRRLDPRRQPCPHATARFTSD